MANQRKSFPVKGMHIWAKESIKWKVSNLRDFEEQIEIAAKKFKSKKQKPEPPLPHGEKVAFPDLITKDIHSINDMKIINQDTSL